MLKKKKKRKKQWIIFITYTFSSSPLYPFLYPFYLIITLFLTKSFLAVNPLRHSVQSVLSKTSALFAILSSFTLIPRYPSLKIHSLKNTRKRPQTRNRVFMLPLFYQSLRSLHCPFHWCLHSVMQTNLFLYLL